MKKGFTLAEVLITLAVIGVVAALTIPTVVHKYQQKQLYTQFMKTYNTIITSFNLALEEHGSTADWVWGVWERDPNDSSNEILVGDGDNPLINFLGSQLKIAKVCEDVNDCFAEEYTSLNGEHIVFDNDEYRVQYFGRKAVLLADGSVISADGNDGDVDFAFDTNGKKGPNVYGRDLFLMRYFVSANESHPQGFHFEDYDTNAEPDEGGYIMANCDPSVKGSEDSGAGCGARLIMEGKMNY